MQLFATEHAFLTGRDISSAAFWSKPLVERDETFSWLRSNAPVSWHPPIEEARSRFLEEAGFWAVTRAADITYVSQHHELFSSALRLPDPILDAGGGGGSFLGMDPPDHNRYRNIISSPFTPKGVARLGAKLVERSEQIVDAVVGTGNFDFVEQVSSVLPMLTIADMVGVPESQIPAFTKAGNDGISASVTDVERPEGMTATDVALNAVRIIREIGTDLVRYRRIHPAEDIASAMARAEIDGRPLNDDEITGYIALLAAAGNDTTKHTASWTALNLCRNPEQKEWLAQDFEGRIGQSVEEFVRHATVVGRFPRTATRDTELGGQEIAAGDKVILFYYSGNRDESLFPDPHRFDLSRPRASHVAFGGRGVHFCLGNVLAKASLRALFREVIAKLPELEVSGEPKLINSDFINGIARLPVTSN